MVKNPFTKRHIKYWQDRKIDWRQAYWNPEHPHRELIVKALKNIKFTGLIEVGCASGANLKKVIDNFPQVEIGGIDLSQDAIETAIEMFGDRAAVLEVSNVTKIFLSDKSADVVLSDMCLIYLDPFTINRALKEIKRITRSNVLFVEFHSKNWFRRMALRLFSGYNSYNYKRLLEKHGFYDVEMYKLTEKDWPGGQPQKEFAYLISAKV